MKTVEEANREAAKLDQLAHEWGMTAIEFRSSTSSGRMPLCLKTRPLRARAATRG